MAELSAGRELDALVAEKVMGLHVGIDFGEWPEHDWKDSDSDATPYVCARCYDSTGWVSEGELARFYKGPCIVEPPPYSTSIAAAWQVVERIRTLHPEWDFDLTWFAEDDWQAQFGLYDGSASAPALAICLAALAAVGHDGKEGAQ